MVWICRFFSSPPLLRPQTGDPPSVHRWRGNRSDTFLRHSWCTRRSWQSGRPHRNCTPECNRARQGRVVFFFVVASRKPSHWATVWKQDGWNVLKPFCWLSKCPNRLTAVQRGARKYDTVNCCHGFHLTDISTASQEADFFFLFNLHSLLLSLLLSSYT